MRNNPEINEQTDFDEYENIMGEKMINRNIERDSTIDRQYKINYARANGKKYHDQNATNIEEEFVSSGKPLEKDNYFGNIFNEYQQANSNNDFEKKNELANRLFATKEQYRPDRRYVTICLDKILYHKIETYKKTYKNKLTSSDIVDTCYTLIYEFLEKPETFVKKNNNESIFTTLTRAMRNALDREYSNIVGAVKQKVANGKRQIHNTIYYQKDFEIYSEKNDEAMDNKTFLNDAAYQAWLKTDNIRIPSEEYKISRQIQQDDDIFKNSPKQKEMYGLLAQGLSQIDVAGIIGCSKANISQQKSKLRKKISRKYGYDFTELSVNDLEYTDLTKKIIRILPEMEDNITYRKSIDYNSLLELLVYFEYKPNKINIERLSLNKIDQDIDFIDIVIWGLPLHHKSLFLNLLCAKRLSDTESIKLYWYMASAFDDYITDIKTHQDILNEYIEYRKRYLDKKTDLKNIG